MRRQKAYGNGSPKRYGASLNGQGESNNLFRSQYGDEDHLQTWTSTGDGNRMWNDIYDDKNPWSHGYILEFGYYSNPNNPDSDGDGYDDGKEVLAKTDPKQSFKPPASEHLGS